MAKMMVHTVGEGFGENDLRPCLGKRILLPYIDPRLREIDDPVMVLKTK